MVVGDILKRLGNTLGNSATVFIYDSTLTVAGAVSPLLIIPSQAITERFASFTAYVVLSTNEPRTSRYFCA